MESVLYIIQHFRPYNSMDVRSLPIWNNSDLGNLEHPTWMSKGIYLLNDVFNDQMEMLSQDELVEFFGIWTNLLENGSIRIKIHTYLKKLGNLNTQTIRNWSSKYFH